MAKRVYRVAFRSTGHGQDIVNTLHLAVGHDIGSDDPDPVDVAAAVADDLVGAYRAVLSVDDTLHDITLAEEIDPVDPDALRAGAVHSVELAGSRALGDNDLPPEVCGMIKTSTAVYGRAFHGRQFLPPVRTIADVNDGILDHSRPYWLAMNTWRARLADFGPHTGTWSSLWSTWEAQLINYSHRRRVLGMENYWATVNGVSVSDQVRWLRSRRS